MKSSSADLSVNSRIGSYFILRHDLAPVAVLSYKPKSPACPIEPSIQMAKFIKSIFSPSERKKSRYEEQEENNDFTPPLDGRRNLSMSRSGRLKQSNKKRNSLSVIIQGEDNFQPVEKPTSVEYHVNAPIISTTKDVRTKEEKISRKPTNDQKTPDEEIDSAFEIIDKT